MAGRGVYGRQPVPLALEHRALYASYDRFPSRKGSGVQTERFSRALFAHAGGGLLYVLGGDGLPQYQREGDVEIVRYSTEGQDLLERRRGFSTRLEALLDGAEPSLRIAHFRDPWSGVVLLDRPHRYATVFEVNGLPSVELPYRHPDVPRQVLERIRELEQRCLDAATAVIALSQVTATALRERGVAPERLHVIRNGADIPAQTARPGDAPERYILYFGALQSWQGFDTALRALAQLPDLQLVVCASVNRHEAEPYRLLARRLGVEDRVIWRFALAEAELAPWREHAVASLAPLRDCSRNTAVGCSPLKILESMAAGVPVIASDLPVSRELVEDGVSGLLVFPDRPGELARAVRRILDLPEEARALAAAARQRVAERFSWQASGERLAVLYETLGRQHGL